MRPSTVLCGSYHRDTVGLNRIFRELEATGVRILSPLSLAFTDPSEAVVRARSEEAFTAAELERYHLRAIQEADFIWLHTPEGHIGLSGAYELGYAKALGKHIFCEEKPNDEMLASQITLVGSVFEALETISCL